MFLVYRPILYSLSELKKNQAQRGQKFPDKYFENGEKSYSETKKLYTLWEYVIPGYSPISDGGSLSYI